MVPAPLRRLRRSVREGPSDAPGRVVDGVLGRVGLVGYGVVHLVVAWLALHVAFGMPTAPADAQGAVGRSPGRRRERRPRPGRAGVVVLRRLAADGGRAWLPLDPGQRAVPQARGRGRQGGRGDRAGRARDRLPRRQGLAARDHGPDHRGRPSRAAGRADPARRGRRRGPRARGRDDLHGGPPDVQYGRPRPHRLGPLGRRMVAGVGAVGHLARAAALAVVGLLAMGAAVSADPDRAGGLDAALRAVGQTYPGAALLVVIATGFAATACSASSTRPPAARERWRFLCGSRERPRGPDTSRSSRRHRPRPPTPTGRADDAAHRSRWARPPPEP